MNETGADIRDVKGLVEIPDPPNYWIWAIIILLVLFAAFALFWWLRRKKKDPTVSAASAAIKELKKAEPLIDETDPGPFVIKVTDAVRYYIEQRFQLAAPRRTTEEFLREVHDDESLGNYQEQLGEFLRCCDVVKFGRADLAIDDRTQMLESARRFIETTKEGNDRG